jgi:hypothetical protein
MKTYMGIFCAEEFFKIVMQDREGNVLDVWQLPYPDKALLKKLASCKEPTVHLDHDGVLQPVPPALFMGVLMHLSHPSVSASH